MATKAEYTIGTNAGMVKALADVKAIVPAFAQNFVTFDKLAPVVADIVVAALDAVDASRAATQAPTSGV